jgi:glycosyltransferase involved in cell wall biosynthesis
MKILQISTSDLQGGAARACNRLALGLRNLNENCDVLVMQRTSDHNFINKVNIKQDEFTSNIPISNYIQDNYINKQRTDVSNTLFSLSCSGYDLTSLDLVRTADIINLHWVVGFQSPRTIARLASLGKPVVWTLHDQWPFTGGCHYSAGCTKYQSDCSSCPQLLDDSAGLVSSLLKDKMHYFEKAHMTIVAPSHWLAACARESTIFHRHRVETISNSLETDIFSPFDKETARNKLGLHKEGLILLFGSENGSEKRKGFKELLSAMQLCMESDNFAGLVRDRKLSVICFGHPAKELESSGLRVIPLGFLDTDENIRNAYCAADIFILPSLEDNLPNTMLESMSCGIPVIAFNTGGMPDAIINGHTGLIVPSGDTRALGNAILSLTFDRLKRERMGQNCRTAAVEKYSLATQAGRYLKLYDELRHLCVVDNQCSRNRCGRPGEHDIAVIETTPGPYLDEIHNRILFKSFILSLKTREFIGTDRISVVHRIMRSIKALLEAMMSTRGQKSSRIVTFLLRLILKSLYVLKNIKGILKRSHRHG